MLALTLALGLLAPADDPTSSAGPRDLGRLASLRDPGPGALDDPAAREAEPATYLVDAAARSSTTLVLPAGPRTVRSLEIRPDFSTADAWRTARLRLIWEDDDPERAGIDLPAGLLAGLVEGAGPIVGRSDAGGTLLAPMPYRRSALLRIDATRPIRGTIRLMSTAGVGADEGYLRARTVEVPAARARTDLPDLLDERGRGHLIGLVLFDAGPGSRATSRVGDGFRIVADGKATASGPGAGLDVKEVRAADPWFLDDPVSFSRSLVVGLEQAGADPAGGGRVAAPFWYSERPGPVADR